MTIDRMMLALAAGAILVALAAAAWTLASGSTPAPRPADLPVISTSRTTGALPPGPASSPVLDSARNLQNADPKSTAATGKTGGRSDYGSAEDDDREVVTPLPRESEDREPGEGRSRGSDEGPDDPDVEDETDDGALRPERGDEADEDPSRGGRGQDRLLHDEGSGC